jgi:solute carrier family 25 S-adenosylmethionine transporter 26
MEKYPNVKPVYIYALASVMGDMTGSVWLCPSEVIKQQMQAGMFQNTREAFSSLWKYKCLGGLYTGYWGGVSRDVPFRIAQLCSYEVTKSLYLKVKARRLRTSSHYDGASSSDSITSQLPLELSAAESALCGAIAGTFSSAITCPLDRIKTLLMTNGEAYGGSVVSCAAKILRDEGMGGFTTGLVPRVAYIAPSVALFFVTYEACQQRLKNWS